MSVVFNVYSQRCICRKMACILSKETPRDISFASRRWSCCKLFLAGSMPPLRVHYHPDWLTNLPLNMRRRIPRFASGMHYTYPGPLKHEYIKSQLKTICWELLTNNIMRLFIMLEPLTEWIKEGKIHAALHDPLGLLIVLYHILDKMTYYWPFHLNYTFSYFCTYAFKYGRMFPFIIFYRRIIHLILLFLINVNETVENRIDSIRKRTFMISYFVYVTNIYKSCY